MVALLPSMCKFCKENSNVNSGVQNYRLMLEHCMKMGYELEKHRFSHW